MEICTQALVFKHGWTGKEESCDAFLEAVFGWRKRRVLTVSVKEQCVTKKEMGMRIHSRSFFFGHERGMVKHRRRHAICGAMQTIIYIHTNTQPIINETEMIRRAQPDRASTSRHVTSGTRSDSAAASASASPGSRCPPAPAGTWAAIVTRPAALVVVVSPPGTAPAGRDAGAPPAPSGGGPALGTCASAPRAADSPCGCRAPARCGTRG